MQLVFSAVLKCVQLQYIFYLSIVVCHCLPSSFLKGCESVSLIFCLPFSITVSFSPGQCQCLAGALSPTCGALQQPGWRPPVGNTAPCKRQVVDPVLFFTHSLPQHYWRFTPAVFLLWLCAAHRYVGGKAMKDPRPLTVSAGLPSPEGVTRWWSLRPPSGRSATCCPF